MALLCRVPLSPPGSCQERKMKALDCALPPAGNPSAATASSVGRCSTGRSLTLFARGWWLDQRVHLNRHHTWYSHPFDAGNNQFREHRPVSRTEHTTRDIQGRGKKRRDESQGHVRSGW
jgi:hypothetical protein